MRTNRYGIVALLVAAVAGGGSGCKAKTIKGVCLPGGKVDLRDLEAQMGQSAPDFERGEEVLVRSLGTAGVYIEWQGEAVLVAPSLTAYRNQRSKVEADREAVGRGLDRLERNRVMAVLIGSGRAERLGDAVEVTKRLRNADLYVNVSAKRMMNPYLEGWGKHQGSGKAVRVKAINGRDHPRMASRGVWIRGSDGERGLIRVRALAFPNEYAQPLLESFQDPWETYRVRDFEVGERFAFSIELFDADRTRLQYKLLVATEGADLEMPKGNEDPLEEPESPAQVGGEPFSEDEPFAEPDVPGEDVLAPEVPGDAPSTDAEPTSGSPIPQPPADNEASLTPPHEGQFDVVVLSLREFLSGEQQPDDLLADAQAGHIVVVDYEAKPYKKGKGIRLRRRLNRRRAGAFVCDLDHAASSVPLRRPKPRTAIKGPRGRRWSLPSPGEWMVFPTRFPAEPKPASGPPQPSPKTDQAPQQAEPPLAQDVGKQTDVEIIDDAT